MKKSGKITDKMRLDWLEYNKFETEYEAGGYWSIWNGGNFTEERKGLRQAIDAELRKSKGKEGR